MSKKKPGKTKRGRPPKGIKQPEKAAKSTRRGRPPKKAAKKLKRRGRKNPIREVLQTYNSIQFNAFFNGFDWETLERMEKEIKQIKKERKQK